MNQNVKKRKRKVFFLVLFCVLFIPLVLYVGINAYAIISAKGEISSLEGASPTDRSDAILVLGCGVRSDATPSNMLEDRLLTALELYQQGRSETVIVSGDHGRADYDEVNVMKNYLIQKGIPSERIFMDHAGFSTYDSLYRARAIFGAESVTVVTQEYHAYRALMIGKALGLDCDAVEAPILCTDATRYYGQEWYSFRESFARCKDFLWCIFRPEPTYLGEPISLSGSGDVTNDR